jgi:hypothetical protein
LSQEERSFSILFLYHVFLRIVRIVFLLPQISTLAVQIERGCIYLF